jgi:hypothetical protein
MSQFYTNSGGGPPPPGTVTELDGNSGTATPSGGIIDVVGTGVAASGVSAAGNIYTIGSGNTLTIYETQAQFLTQYNSTNIDFAHSPYVAILTDYFISVNTSGGSVVIQLPNSPTTYRMFIVKDRTGNSIANPLTVTTVGGVVLIDGSATYTIEDDYQATNFVFNGTSYEAF